MIVGTGKWKSGVPAARGWYNASIIHNGSILRWWNGKCWSISCGPSTSKKKASMYANESLPPNDTDIEWRPLKKQYRK